MSDIFQEKGVHTVLGMLGEENTTGFFGCFINWQTTISNLSFNSYYNKGFYF